MDLKVFFSNSGLPPLATIDLAMEKNQKDCYRSKYFVKILNIEYISLENVSVGIKGCSIVRAPTTFHFNVFVKKYLICLASASYCI